MLLDHKQFGSVFEDEGVNKILPVCDSAMGTKTEKARVRACAYI